MRDVEWQQADLFYRDLVGTRAPGRPSRPIARRPPVPPPPVAGTGLGDPDGLFDNIVHRGMEAAPLLESESAEEEGAAWEAVALTGSATPPDQLPRHALVVRRALGEGRLASIQILCCDVERPALYAPDGRIRADVLVIVRRASLSSRPRTIFLTTEDESAPFEPEDASEDRATEDQQEDSDLSFL